MKNTRTNEHHIFKSTKRGSIVFKSICKKCDAIEDKVNLRWVNTAKYVNDKTIREVAERLGRAVCATCLSHFYADQN